MGKGMDGMTIDKINGSPIMLNTDYKLNTQAVLDRSAMTLGDTRQIEQTITQRKDADGMLSKERLADTVDKLNSFLESGRRNLKFELHDKLEKYYVTVVDSETSEIIKEIPPKKLLDMYAAMAEFMGILVDKKI